jgi:hypothetical protein
LVFITMIFCRLTAAALSATLNKSAQGDGVTRPVQAPKDFAVGSRLCPNKLIVELFA